MDISKCLKLLGTDARMYAHANTRPAAGCSEPPPD